MCYNDIEELKSKSEELLEKLEKVDTNKLGKIPGGDKNYFLENPNACLADDDTRSVLNELYNIKGDRKKIERYISDIKKNLTKIQEDITTNGNIIKQIKELSTRPVSGNGNIGRYRQFVRKYKSFEKELPNFANQIDNPIKQLESKFKELDNYIDPLISLSEKVINSKYIKQEVKRDLLLVIIKLALYKFARNSNFRIIKDKYDYLNEFISKNKDSFDKIEKYTQILEAVKGEVEKITKELTEYQDNLSKIDPGILDNHFKDIESQKNKLSSYSGDPVGTALEQIISWKETNLDKLKNMKDFWVRLNNINRKIGTYVKSDKGNIQRYTTPFKVKPQSSKPKIDIKLYNTVNNVKSKLKTYKNIEDLEKKSQEILGKLNLVNVDQLGKGPEELLRYKIIPHPNTDSIIKPLDKIKYVGTIKGYISTIQSYLMSIKNAITSINKQIQQLSTTSVNGSIRQYKEFVRDYLSIKNQFPTFTNKLDRYITGANLFIKWLDIYIKPLLNVKDKVESSTMNEDIKKEIEGIIRRLIYYKVTKITNFNIIKDRLKYLKDFKTLIKPKIDKINTYIQIHKEVGEIISELTPSISDIEKLDTVSLKIHFKDIESKGLSLSGPYDLAKKELTNIKTYQGLLDNMKQLNDKLKPVQTKTDNLQFDNISSFNPGQFNVEELDKSFQVIKEIKEKYSYIGGLETELDNIVAEIDELQKMKKVLIY